VNEKFPPTELFGPSRSLLFPSSLCLIQNNFTEHTDPGTRANPAKPNLLGPNTKTNDISPYIGTEITGVQISQLNDAGLDEIALYAAQRKLLVFRDQDFKDLSPDRQIEIAR
jgi:sulfonate dioxygenase